MIAMRYGLEVAKTLLVNNVNASYRVLLYHRTKMRK